MFQRQRVLLEGGVAVGHRRMPGVAGFRGKAEIRNMQVLQPRFMLPVVSSNAVPGVTGMQRQQQEYGQRGCNKQYKWYRTPHICLIPIPYQSPIFVGIIFDLKLVLVDCFYGLARNFAETENAFPFVIEFE